MQRFRSLTAFVARPLTARPVLNAVPRRSNYLRQDKPDTKEFRAKDDADTTKNLRDTKKAMSVEQSTGATQQKDNAWEARQQKVPDLPNAENTYSKTMASDNLSSHSDPITENESTRKHQQASHQQVDHQTPGKSDFLSKSTAANRKQDHRENKSGNDVGANIAQDTAEKRAAFNSRTNSFNLHDTNGRRGQPVQAPRREFSTQSRQSGGVDPIWENAQSQQSAQRYKSDEQAMSQSNGKQENTKMDSDNLGTKKTAKSGQGPSNREAGKHAPPVDQTGPSNYSDDTAQSDSKVAKGSADYEYLTKKAGGK